MTTATTGRRRQGRAAREQADALARVAKSAAIYQACLDYHGGQNSRGYRLAVYLRRRLQRHGITADPRTFMCTTTYEDFSAAYFTKL